MVSKFHFDHSSRGTFPILFQGSFCSMVEKNGESIPRTLVSLNPGSQPASNFPFRREEAPVPHSRGHLALAGYFAPRLSAVSTRQVGEAEGTRQLGLPSRCTNLLGGGGGGWGGRGKEEGPRCLKKDSRYGDTMHTLFLSEPIWFQCVSPYPATAVYSN